MDECSEERHGGPWSDRKLFFRDEQPLLREGLG